MADLKGRRHLEVVVLPLLLRLQEEASEAAQVLAAHSLVDCGSAADTLPVVVRHVGPPIGLSNRGSDFV